MKRIKNVLRKPITWGGYLKLGLVSSFIGGIISLIYYLYCFTDIPTKCTRKIKTTFNKIFKR